MTIFYSVSSTWFDYRVVLCCPEYSMCIFDDRSFSFKTWIGFKVFYRGISLERVSQITFKFAVIGFELTHLCWQWQRHAITRNKNNKKKKTQLKRECVHCQKLRCNLGFISLGNYRFGAIPPQISGLVGLFWSNVQMSWGMWISVYWLMYHICVCYIA